MSKTKEVSLHELWQKECKQKNESTPVHIFEARTQMPAHLFQGAALCVIAIGIIGICAGLGVFKGIIDSAPTITLEDATPTRYSSFIYDSKGNQMAKLIAEDSNRVPVTMDQIPTDLANAFVAIEDERFYQHNGIDIMGILRAGVTAVKTGFKRQEGASTITQQLIKNTVLTTWTQEKTLGERIKRKVQSSILRFSWKRILTTNPRSWNNT